MLWGKSCTVKTRKGRQGDKAVWYTGHPHGASEEHLREPV